MNKTLLVFLAVASILSVVRGDESEVPHLTSE